MATNRRTRGNKVVATDHTMCLHLGWNNAIRGFG